MNVKTIISVLVVAAVISIGGVFVLRQSAQPQPESVPALVPPAEVPADWKTYRNEKLGWELRYPPEWEVLTNSDGRNNQGQYVLSISLRNKKWDSSYAWPGLQLANIDMPGEFQNTQDTNSFIETDAQYEVVRIHFQLAGQTIYASCALYTDKQMLETCSQIISTLKIIIK